MIKATVVFTHSLLQQILQTLCRVFCTPLLPERSAEDTRKAERFSGIIFQDFRFTYSQEVIKGLFSVI
jgi:hypothetical protein